jgi:hypothetical protein
VEELAVELSGAGVAINGDHRHRRLGERDEREKEKKGQEEERRLTESVKGQGSQPHWRLTVLQGSYYVRARSLRRHHAWCHSM